MVESGLWLPLASGSSNWLTKIIFLLKHYSKVLLENFSINSTVRLIFYGGTSHMELLNSFTKAAPLQMLSNLLGLSPLLAKGRLSENFFISATWKVQGNSIIWGPKPFEGVVHMDRGSKGGEIWILAIAIVWLRKFAIILTLLVLQNWH